MVNLIGFNGPAPHSVILWQLGGVNTAKTVCYSLEEQNEALNRFHSQGDIYNRYDKAVIITAKDEVRVRDHQILRGA